MAENKTPTNEELIAQLEQKNKELSEKDEAIQSLTEGLKESQNKSDDRILTIGTNKYKMLYPKIVFEDKIVSFADIKSDSKLAAKILKQQDGSLTPVE